jgi:AraC-like DNA-binding protein
MNYAEFQPAASLRSFVECYWVAEGTVDPSAPAQKIVPDGFTEIVFDYGDLYKFTSSEGVTRIQSRAILAGQITKPVYLKPTGVSGVIGIKFKPTGIWKLFGWNMAPFTDDAVDLKQFPASTLEEFISKLIAQKSVADKIQVVEEILLQRLPEARRSVADDLVSEIDASKGTIALADLQKKYTISTRKMERLFLEQVGLSAKRYARLVRFRHVFQLLQKSEWTKTEAAYLAGYFDQAHFNKEFKEFSGEDPGTYFSQHHEFANFFLNRPVVFLQG